MNYYNEWDPQAAAWLRELISERLIPRGLVDERSIAEVKAEDLEGFTQCHFFARIGGWPLALQLAGVDHRTPLWTGSPPCQPFSAAGKQLGQFDPRHLAPVFLELISQCLPPVLFGEQVAPAIAKSWMCDLQAHLEGEDYAVGFAVLPACSVGAPHKRERLFFGAYNLADAPSARHLRSESTEAEARRESQHGFTRELSTRPCGHSISTIQQSAGMGVMAESLRTERDCERLYGLGESHKTKGSGTTAELTGCGDIGRMGHTDSERLQRERRDSNQERREGQNFRQTGLLDGTGSEIGVAYTTTGGRREECQNSGRFIVGDSAERQPAGRSAGGCDNPADSHHSFWSDADWLGCRDGKFRPVESGTFPLANGISARVGRLRGYGNAIVPEVAAEFVRAFLAASENAIKG